MDESQRRALLRFVRLVLLHELGGEVEPEPPESLPAMVLGGVFVTIRKGSRLRGCMGTFSLGPSLTDTLSAVARSAARDPRFTHAPLRGDEAAELDIEVSLLGPLEPVSDVGALEVGRHGIMVRQGHRSGCFLPQVAVEHGWSMEELLSRCCELKADLPSDAWRKPETQLFSFTAETLHDPQ